MSQKRLQGKTALITGGSKGLGKAMALALAEEGATVLLVSRDRGKLESVAEEAGSSARVFVADVSREEEVERLRKEVAAAHPRLDILINNAGINIRRPIQQLHHRTVRLLHLDPCIQQQHHASQ